LATGAVADVTAALHDEEEEEEASVAGEEEEEGTAAVMRPCARPIRSKMGWRAERISFLSLSMRPTKCL
jgi:hypothetical protein